MYQTFECGFIYLLNLSLIVVTLWADTNLIAPTSQANWSSSTINYSAAAVPVAEDDAEELAYGGESSFNTTLQSSFREKGPPAFTVSLYEHKQSGLLKGKFL